MKELFGVPTSTIAVVLVALLAVAIATVLFIAITNRTWFRMGLRNLPRRGVQTLLVVIGLMLGTLITTAAFVTGDTIDHTLSKNTYALFQRSDLDLTWNGEREFGSDYGADSAGAQATVDIKAVESVEAAFAGDPEIESFLPSVYGQAPARNARTGKATPAIEVAGYDPVRLGRAGGLRLTNGSAAPLDLADGQVYLNTRAARELGAREGDTIEVVTGGVARELRVAGIVKAELASGELGAEYSSIPGGLALPLPAARALLGYEGNEVTHLTVALRGGVRDTLDKAKPAAARLQAYFEGDGRFVFGPANGLEAGREVEVITMKKDFADASEQAGNIFTTFFLVLGLFSMAAGVMLIFMIFIMLAAERRAEMGMARAIGAQRSHLVQSFIAEGMAYSLLAGVVGAALGVAASYGMTNVLLKQAGGDYFSLVEFKATTTSLVIGYSLGVVITFITVVFASLKAGHVNIVAAIRGLEDERARRGRRAISWRWLILGVPALVLPPVGLWFLLRKGLGLPWTWILAPAGVVAGLLLMALGHSSEKLFPFALGISLLPLCVAAMVRYLGAPSRATWTAVGIALLAYWLLPQDTHDDLFGKFDSDIEMFVISGVMLSIASTLIIVFNGRTLLGLFTGTAEGARAYVAPIVLGAAAVASTVAALAIGDGLKGLGELLYLGTGLFALAAMVAAMAARFPQVAPALKMAVAYPLANRFRTGMTITMFSIIVFSLTVFSIILDNFSSLFSGASARGNIDIVATAQQGNGITDLGATLREVGSPAAGQLAAAGRTTLHTGASVVRQPGAAEFSAYPVLAADDPYFAAVRPSLDAFARSYASEEEVREAVRKNSALALIDATVIGDFSDYDWAVRGVEIKDERFDPFQVELRNTDTGQVTIVTVVGVLKTKLPSAIVSGVYINEEAYRALFGAPAYQRHYLRLGPGAEAKGVAASIESSLALRGVEADSVQKLLDDANATNLAFNRMFQAFMALGLIVGIAGLGVIAFRSVVERRQQIGMLRAIGYQRGTVTLTFLLESCFIAAMGIIAGVAGGSVLGRNLLTSDSFTDGAKVAFAIPWTEVGVVVVASFAFALLMTWWPSRSASRVAVAEALRYE